MQLTLLADPNAGDVIPGSGGVRKLRWRQRRLGKRGGYRVIYFVKRTSGVFWMLTIYPKNVTENVPIDMLRRIRKEVQDE